MKRTMFACYLAFALLLVVTVPGNSVYAQAVANAQISGNVTDGSGAGVPGAKIIATQTSTNTVRTTVSGADGTYLLPALPVGPYKLRVEAKAFETYIQTGINLQVDESPKINITLRVGEVTQQVVVNAAAAMVQTDSSSLSQVIDQKRILELPLNGRVPTQLIMLSGAANDTSPRYSDLTGSKNYFSADNISVAGGEANGTDYLLDGAENIDTFSNVNLPLPFPDALQEFSVETSALSARYGLHAGAVVNTVTKSGTNQIHGDLFEFVRNGAMNARDYFATSRDQLKRNQFGGTVGGPILKNKLFGFLGYQKTLIRTAPPTSISYVPTQAVLNGDFSQLESASCQSSGKARTIYDPTKPDPNNPGQYLPFTNSQVPVGRFNPQALNFLKHVPVSSDPCGKLQFALPEPQSEQQILVRGDANLSPKNSIFAHYFSGDYLSPGPDSSSNILLSQQRGVVDHSKSIVVGDTYTVTPTIVNAAHIGYTRLAITRGPSSNGGVNFASLGVNLPYQPLPNYLSLSVSGYFSAGCGTCSTAILNQNNIQLADDVDIFRGRQHISFGVEGVNHRDLIEFTTLAAGQFSFNTQVTNDALVSFMLGLPSSLTQGNIQRFDGGQNYFGTYVHDVVQLNKRLTAQLGVRWEPNLWGSERAGRMQHFDMAAFNAGTVSNVYPNAPAGLLFPGDPGVGSSFAQNHPGKFEPRAGVSWDITGKGRQVIRAGYGLFYDLLSLGYWEDQTADAPWGNQIALSSPSGGFTNPYAGYPGGNPFPTPQPPPHNVSFPSKGVYITYPSNMHQMYTNQWNLTYELQPFTNWAFSAAYLGNTSVHVLSGEDINPGVYIPGTCGSAPCSTTTNTDKRRVLYLKNPTLGAAYSDIFQADDGGIERYEGLLLKGEHRFSSNYTVLVNYTYSHCIGDAEFSTDFAFQQTQNPDNLKGEQGNCSFDIRHIANISFVGESPRLSNRLAANLIGRWKLAPILSMRSGTWFTLGSGKDNSLTGVGNDRPNQVGNPYVRNLTTKPYPTWITASAFTQNPTGAFGNSRRNSLEGPGSINVDAALSREFNIHDHGQFEFRFEAFNVANHTNFNNPSSTLTSSTFGLIKSDVSPRILQLAGKFTF